MLAIAILIGHNLVVEGAVLHKAGMNGFAFGALRIVAGLAAAGRRQPADGAGLMTDFLREFATGSLDLLLRVFLIVVPIMVVLELFEGTRAFRAVVRAWARLVAPRRARRALRGAHARRLPLRARLRRRA